jgi:protein TonB
MTEGCADTPRDCAGGSAEIRPGEPSDLFRLCLREEAREPARFLAWANSVCLLFLVVGLIGFWRPSVRVGTALPAFDSVPVAWTVPEPERKIGSLLTKSIGQAEIPLEAPDALAPEIPKVASVASVTIPEKIAFPVLPKSERPLAGQEQAKGPGQHYVPARPIAFQPSTSGAEAFTPPPEYPPRALRTGREGTVIIEFSVRPAGEVHSVTVHTTSGYGDLDEAAMAVVRDKWRFGPGSPRSYLWACTFQIKRSEK